MKKISELLSENFHFFFSVKFSIYLNRRVIDVLCGSVIMILGKRDQAALIS